MLSILIMVISIFLGFVYNISKRIEEKEIDIDY
jgi:hypothetical protein